MGNCPLIDAFPIKCCRYTPKVVLSYRYDYSNKDNKIMNKDNIITENINIISPIKNEQLNKNELNNEDNKNNYSINEHYEEKSVSSNKVNKNNSRFKYNNLITYKRPLSTEEFIKLKINKDTLNKYRINSNLKSNTKTNFFLNQYTSGTNFRHFMTKQTTSTTNSVQKLIFNLSIINEDETNNNKELIINILKKNIFFRMNFNDRQLGKLVSLMLIYEITPNNNNIFSKDDYGNSFFVLEKGELFIYNTYILNNNNMFNNNSLLINGDYTFGELCLLNQKENIKRTYSISSLSILKFYILNKEQYDKFLIYEKINIKTIDIKIIKNIELFKYFNEEELFYISKFSYLFDEIEINKNNNEQNNNMKFLSFSEFLNLNLTISKQDPRTLFLKFEIPNYSTKYLIISVHSIIEIFGINFKYQIILRVFNHKIKKDLSLFTSINKYYLEIILFYSIFKYKYFDKQSSLGIKLSSNNNFIILILQGNMELYDDKNNITNYNSFDYINTNIIENKSKIFFSKFSIIIHAKYEEALEKIKNIQEIFSLVINKKYVSPFLSILNNDEILFVLNKMKMEKYIKDDIIINDENECTKFYIIMQGKVKHKSYNDKTIQKYTENDCFGELFLLDDINKYLKDTYIYASSENLITVELNKEDFFILLKNPKINDYIKLKMCLEDKSINFSDLYYLYPLYETRLGNLYLVHNGIFLYIIKSISKLIIQGYENEKQYIINKINILKTINHKFIVKMVTKFKNDNWYFLLMEYVTGIKLNEAIKFFPNSPTNSNLLIDYITFYSAIIFIIIDYLHNHKIIHRDLKINNFMIERDGYLKLIDMGSAKKILNGYAKTMLGTPHYIAPEIIEGSNYSFSADYYSIGICLYYLLYNKFPFGNEEKDAYKIYQDIINKKVIFDENNISKNINKYPELIHLISNLLIKDPNKRISNIDIIKSNLFFKGFEWNLLFSKKIKAPFIPFMDNKSNKDNLLNDYRISFETFIEKEKLISSERETSRVKIENNISEGLGSDIIQQIEILKEEY